MIISTDTQERLYITDCGTPVCEGHIQPYIDDALPASPTDYDAWLQCHGRMMSCQRCVGGAYDTQRDGVGDPLLREINPQRRAGDDTAGQDCGETQSISPSFVRYAEHRHISDLA